jgi:hypothetical protein
VSKRHRLTAAEKWQRKADRANIKARHDAGLFADLVPTVTGNDLAARSGASAASVSTVWARCSSPANS